MDLHAFICYQIQMSPKQLLVIILVLLAERGKATSREHEEQPRRNSHSPMTIYVTVAHFGRLRAPVVVQIGY